MSNYQAVKEWRRANPEAVASQARRYRARHPEKVAAVKRRYRAANLEKVRKTEAERAHARRAQDPEAQRLRNQKFAERKRARQVEMAGRDAPEVCDICRGQGRIVWDHCHATDRFRGWICDRCNKALGMVRDDPALLRLLASYLER